MVCKTCAPKNPAEVKRARKRPGGSNVGEYSRASSMIFAGPAGGSPKGSYPLTKNGRLDESRVRSALSLAHNSPNPTALKRFIGKTLVEKGNSTMKTLGKRVLDKLTAGRPDKIGDKENKFGGNKGDESSSKRDYANFKDTDKGYKSKAFGEGHGDRSKSRRDYMRKK